MKEAIWGAGLVRGLTGEQKNTGAGAGEGIDSFFVILALARDLIRQGNSQGYSLRFAFRYFALLAKNQTTTNRSFPPPSTHSHFRI